MHTTSDPGLTIPPLAHAAHVFQRGGPVSLLDAARLEGFILQSAGLAPTDGCSWEDLHRMAKDAVTLTSQGLADTTKSKYEFNLKHVVTIHPCLLPMNSAGKIMVFFSTLKGSNWSKVCSYRSAISALHRYRNWHAPPFDEPIVQAFLQGLQKSCNNRVVGKIPISKEEMTALVTHWFLKQSNNGYRNAFLAVVQFYGMRRISEVLALTREQIIDLGVGNGFVIRVDRQKNDKYGRGMEVPLPEHTTDNIPIGPIIRQFLLVTQNVQGILVRASRGKHQWNEKDTGVMDRGVWNTAIKDAYKVLWPDRPDTSLISSHSFRKGGFTAARQAGMPHDCAIDVIGHSPGSDAWLAYLKRPRAEKMMWVARM